MSGVATWLWGVILWAWMSTQLGEQSKNLMQNAFGSICLSTLFFWQVHTCIAMSRVVCSVKDGLVHYLSLSVFCFEQLFIPCISYLQLAMIIWFCHLVLLDFFLYYLLTDKADCNCREYSDAKVWCSFVLQFVVQSVTTLHKCWNEKVPLLITKWCLTP